MTPTFTCPHCGRTSHNPHDAREGYCGACHWWTGVPELYGPWLDERRHAFVSLTFHGPLGPVTADWCSHQPGPEQVCGLLARHPVHGGRQPR